VQAREGLRMGVQNTHLPKESPYYISRQFQLRHLGQNALEKKSDIDLFYSSPLSISQADAEWFREALLDMISKLAKRVQKTEPTDLYCINMDWFKLS
jgi:hypothetical protein